MNRSNFTPPLVSHPPQATFALTRQGPPVDPSETDTNQDALQLHASWGTTGLLNEVLRGAGSIVVGDAPRSVLQISADLLGAPSWELVTASRGIYSVQVPSNGVAILQRAEVSTRLAAGACFTTLRGDGVTIELGEFRFELSHGVAGRAIPAAALGERVKRSALGQIAGAALLHAAFFAVFAYNTPALASDDSASAREEQLVLMREYLTAAALREPEAQPSASGEGSPKNDDRAMPREPRARQGRWAKSSAPSAHQRWGKFGPKDNPDPTLDRARERELASARDFGMIGLLAQNQSDPNAPVAPWGRDEALGRDPLSALGNMWGPSIGEASGTTVVDRGEGTRRGGSGQGIGVDLDAIGGLHAGRGPGGPGGEGHGHNCPGCTLAGHTTRAPNARMAGPVEVNGHLPAEVIQRVVRSNFGRFRGCYEAGLRDNPALAGRVVTRFAVDSQGMVSIVQDGGSSLPSPGVVACVIRSFYSLSFPAHEGGIVRVTYPLALSPE